MVEISRRSTLKGIGVSSALAALGGASNASLRTERPNIVLVVVDDMRFDEFSAGGHPYLKTPNIDRVAREGASFEQAFHATPLCSPNRACILTGEYASKHGIFGNGGRDLLSRELRTVTKQLKASGYTTAHVGKWHMGNDPKPRPGYDYWVSFPGQGRIFDPQLWENGELHKVTGYITDLLTQRALTFLQQRDTTKPFFLYLGHKAVHPDVIQRNDGSIDVKHGSDYIPAPRHAGRYAGKVFPRASSAIGAIPRRPKSKMVEHFLARKGSASNEAEFGGILDPGTSEATIRARAEMMLSVDESVGALLDGLEQAGALDRTIFVVTSDNGFFFGEHGLSIERRLPYEEAIRMPILMRYPAAVGAGTKVAALGSSIDLAPTLLDLAGLVVPKHMHGVSMRAALSGRSVQRNIDGVLIEYASSDEPMPWLLDADYRAIRTATHKYVHWLQRPEFDELYDLKNDPYEIRNIIAREPGLARGLRARLSVLVTDAIGLRT